MRISFLQCWSVVTYCTQQSSLTFKHAAPQNGNDDQQASNTQMQLQMQHNSSTQIACNLNLLGRAQLLQQSLHSYLEIAVGGQSVVRQGQIGHWGCVMLGQPVCYSISLIVVVICCCNRVLKVVLRFATAAMIVMHGPDAELFFNQQVRFASVLGREWKQWM